MTKPKSHDTTVIQSLFTEWVMRDCNKQKGVFSRVFGDARYPHRCPKCGLAAYVGLQSVEHEGMDAISKVNRRFQERRAGSSTPEATAATRVLIP